MRWNSRRLIRNRLRFGGGSRTPTRHHHMTRRRVRVLDRTAILTQAGAFLQLIGDGRGRAAWAMANFLLDP
jgi:hypothetical protein